MDWLKAALLILAGVHIMGWLPNVAWGAERYEFYNGVRPLAMGGASIATVNDETAVILNPAGLGRLRDYIGTMVDPEIHIGEDTQAIVGTKFLDAMDPQKALDMLNEHKGKRLHQKGQVFPSFVVPNFGLGFLGKYSINARVNEAGDNYRLDYVNDYAFALGYNFRLFDGRVKLGFNTRIVNRVAVHKDLDPSRDDITLKNTAVEGMGVASDVGLVMTAPWQLLPTISVVARDMGHTRYDLKDGLFLDTNNHPETVQQTVDASVALFPIFANHVRGVFTAEYRDVLTANEVEDQMRRVHVGSELNIYDALFVRAGMNQRYWTAGFEFAIMNYQIQFATYGEEVGTKDNPKEDRRYVGKFSYRF